MNSVECASKVLERIAENMDSFEEGEHITHLLNSVCKIGSYALQKSLPCLLLRNVFLILQHFQSHHSHVATAFISEANYFFKTKTLCQNFKLVFLTYFPPAVETEVLRLLNMCAKIKTESELPRIQSEIQGSILVLACSDNPKMLHKANNILKQCFHAADGNPVVGYLISTFNKTVMNGPKPVDCTILFPEELCHLGLLFSLPHSLLHDHQRTMYFKQILGCMIDSVEKRLCDSTDLLFLMVVFPSLFYETLVSHKDQTFDAFRFLRIIYNVKGCEGRDFRVEVDKILKNPVWKYLLQNL